MNKSPKKVLYFIIATYIPTIIFFSIMSSMGGRINPVAQGLMGIPMIFPLLAVIVVQKLIFREKLIAALGISFKWNRWFPVAIVVPVLMAVLLNGVCILLLGPMWSPVAGIVPTFLMNTVMGLTLAAMSALLEETAWRGFLYRELRPLGFWRSAFITAALWSLWHIPVVLVFKYPDYPLQGILVNTVLLFSVSLLLSCIREFSKSVIPVALMHGLLNTLFLADGAVFSAGMGVFGAEGVKTAVAVLALAVLLAVWRIMKNKASREAAA